MSSQLIFHQLFESETSTYTYILADSETREAVIIDPVIEMIERDLKLLEELELKLKFVLDTHVHADHITGSGEIRQRTGAMIGVSAAYDLACPDLHLEDNQEIQFGRFTITAFHTPGHTSGCMSFKLENFIFSGDALLVRGCGRTDFQGGSSEKLFQSVRDRIFSLPDETVVYPAHDYKGFTKTSVGLEKKLNPRLNLKVSCPEFIRIMANLNLAQPKKIDMAVPANFLCGLPASNNFVNSGAVEGIPTINPEELHTKLNHFKIIDVRGSDEFNNELGHVPHAELMTLGDDLSSRLKSADRQQEYVFVCRSGKRSAQATQEALAAGFKHVHNMAGGMLRWKELNLPVERDRGGS